MPGPLPPRSRRPPPHAVAFWEGREVLSGPPGLVAEVVAVGLCRHARLCNGVRLVLWWEDGLETEACSYDLVDGPDGYTLPS